jgi:hypothetical protein
MIKVYFSFDIFLLLLFSPYASVYVCLFVTIDIYTHAYVL